MQTDESSEDYSSTRQSHVTPDNMPEPIFKVIRFKREHRIVNCKHSFKKHYAKGMCKGCYNQFGRDLVPTRCPHKDRKVFAKGQCSTCYNAKRYVAKQETKVSRDSETASIKE